MRSPLSGGLPNTLGDCNRIRELDGLRGVAIGMVVLFHFFQNTMAFPPGPCFRTYKLGCGSLGPALICSSCCLDSSLAGFCWIRALRQITTPCSISGASSESFLFTLLRCSSFPRWFPWGRGRRQAGSRGSPGWGAMVCVFDVHAELLDDPRRDSWWQRFSDDVVSRR